MQHLKVGCAVRRFFTSLAFKGLMFAWQCTATNQVS